VSLSATIAWCPEHGLQGDRDECFKCGRQVEEVELVALADYRLMQRHAAEQENAARRQAERAAVAERRLADFAIRLREIAERWRSGEHHAALAEARRLAG
jgi:hypothetical protein